MSNLRTGTYGEYYGSFFNESVTLTGDQMRVNARYIYSALTDKGWTQEAIAGLLGNMENESAINPGRWQSDDVGNTSMGYSLVQWTPSTKYTEWCTAQGFSDPSTMDAALARLSYELERGLQYASTTDYPLTFQEFAKSTAAPYYLACAFAWNYERSWVVLYGTEAEKEQLRQIRGGDAEKWYTYLTGTTPQPPGGGGSITLTKRRRKYNFVLFGNKSWRNT